MNGSARSLSGWSVAAGLAAALAVAYLLRIVLVPFVIAGALAYLTAPAARLLSDRLRWPRWLATVLVFAATAAALGSLAYWLAVVVLRQAAELTNRAPQVLGLLLGRLLGGDQVELFGHTLHTADLARQTLDSLESHLLGPALVKQSLEAAVLASMGSVLTLVLYFYFLLDGEKLGRGALRLVPPDHRQRVHALAQRVHPILHRYLAGLVAVVIYTSLASWLLIGLVLGIPRAELLAVATGLLELVPVIGPIASAVLVSAAAVEHGGVATLLWFIVFYTALRLSIDQVVGPLVLGRAVRLHPVVVLFAFLAGGTLFGILGVLMAVPAAAVVNLVLSTYRAEADGLSRS